MLLSSRAQRALHTDPAHLITGCVVLLLADPSLPPQTCQPAKMALATKSVCTSRVAAARPARASVVVRAQAQSRRELLGFGAAMLATLAAAAPAKADLTADLLAKSQANKALNDKKRLATSSANVARSRTVADGTCSFPQNMFGCETSAAKFTGGVKYIADDYALECEGSDKGKCASKVQVKF